MSGCLATCLPIGDRVTQQCYASFPFGPLSQIQIWRKYSPSAGNLTFLAKIGDVKVVVTWNWRQIITDMKPPLQTSELLAV